MNIHFGYSKSRNYGQAVFLSNQLSNHAVKGEGINQWHIVNFDELNDNHVNIAANIYKLTSGCRYPRFYGADIHHIQNCAKNNGKYQKTTDYIHAPNGKQAEKALKKLVTQQSKTYESVTQEVGSIIRQIDNDTERVKDLLLKSGYVERSEYGFLVGYTDKLKKVVTAEYEAIKRHVANKDYSRAIDEYYRSLGTKMVKNDVFSNELIYLKREANVQLSGLELVALRGVGKNNKIVSKNMSEFVRFVDDQIKLREDKGLPTPLDVLKDQIPTVEEMIHQRKIEWHDAVHFDNGKVIRDNTPVTEERFSVQYDKCLNGNVFKCFPDPVRRSEVIDMPASTKYWSLWTPIKPQTYMRNVTDKGLHLGSIDCLEPAGKGYLLIKGDDIKKYKANEVSVSPVGGNDVVYTGRSHRIGFKKYFEIHVIREDIDKAKKVGNVLLELLDEIFRDAENELRTNLGLPRIGEGWLSEMEMFRIIKNLFPSAVHHAKPGWLKPQHLDVYVEGQKLAFEYQGRQHYEPVEYFGGQESFNNLRKLDQRKRRLCKNNGVTLIYWDYNEPIDEKLLIEKIEKS